MTAFVEAIDTWPKAIVAVAVAVAVAWVLVAFIRSMSE